MEMRLVRIARKDGYTIGRLYVDGARFCDTLEDRDRGLTKSMGAVAIGQRKVKGVTAIPTGRYRVLWTWSPKYKRMMPLLDGVPGFSGVRIHSGNSAKDTEGCVLVGVNKEVGRVLDSRATVARLYPLIEAACKGGGCWISIE